MMCLLCAYEAHAPSDRVCLEEPQTALEWEAADGIRTHDLLHGKRKPCVAAQARGALHKVKESSVHAPTRAVAIRRAGTKGVPALCLTGGRGE